jgi:hypothetical protein
MPPMIREKNFSYHVARSKMDTFEFETCVRCKETVIKARMRETQGNRFFDPQPVGGTELDRVYSQHNCGKYVKKGEDDEEQWGDRF